MHEFNPRILMLMNFTYVDRIRLNERIEDVSDFGVGCDSDLLISESLAFHALKTLFELTTMSSASDNP